MNASTPSLLAAFDDPKHHIRIYQGDCLEILQKIPEPSVDLVFADPPYFLSNGGITCHAGKMVSVNKGEWDKSRGPDANHEFNRAWLAACQLTISQARGSRRFDVTQCRSMFVELGGPTCLI